MARGMDRAIVPDRGNPIRMAFAAMTTAAVMDVTSPGDSRTHYLAAPCFAITSSICWGHADQCRPALCWLEASHSNRSEKSKRSSRAGGTTAK